MAGIGNKIKLTVLKGMEAVGQGASSLASNAQQKLQELNLETQRREILSGFPLKAYDLWQKGETLPEPLEKMLQELSDLDERLGVLRAQRYVKVEAAEGESPAEGEQESSASDEEKAFLDENSTEGEGENQEEAMASVEDASSQPVDMPMDPGADTPMDSGETGDNA